MPTRPNEPSEPHAVAVMLICSSEHEATLAGLIHRVEAAGLPLRVELDGQRAPERIAARLDELDEAGARGLFVLCECGQADELGYRRIESALANKPGGPLRRLIRLDLIDRSPTVLATRITRECEELAKLEASMKDRLASLGKPTPSRLAPIDERPGISLPAIRLEPGEQLEGDTLRIDLPDSPKLAELARRRKALRERGHGPARLPAQELGSTATGRLLERAREFPLDRKAVVFLVGAALLAVLVALLLGGLG